MDRAEKKRVVQELHSVFTEAKIVVVTHYKGLTVDEIGSLRGSMRNLGAGFKVTKNRLTKLALVGTQYTGIAYSEDPIAAAKGATEFAQQNSKFVVIGGAFGEQPLDPSSIQFMASLPSLDQLRAKILRTMSTPASRIACILEAPAGQLARVLSAHAEKEEAE